MGLLRELNKIRGGWPGGWKQYARGYVNDDTTPPFHVPSNPDDRRSLIPPLGLKEYWYPALPDKDVGWKKPIGLKISGEDLVLFRGKDGQVKALWDYCPHRGAYLSWGDCFWKGFVSCPYHGATFDGDGECVEFITEGPDSKMVGRVKAKAYPTFTIKGIVFVWMGEGEPVDPKEDIPPEFFEDKNTLILSTFRYWDLNWAIALENTSDAHNCFYVHRDSLTQLRSKTGGRPRTPLGYPSRMVNNKAVTTAGGAGGRGRGATPAAAGNGAAATNGAANGGSANGGAANGGAAPGTAATPEVRSDSTTWRGPVASYYAEKNGGVLPYQMYYPRAGGVWPLYKKRLAWTWFFEWANTVTRKWNHETFKTPEEWTGMRLPGMQRLNFGPPGGMYTRWCVPVEEDLTRAVYFRSVRLKHPLAHVWEKVSFALYRNWFYHYNFSDQDYDAMRSCRYQYPEYLSATDSHVVAERRLITEHGRGLKKIVEVNEMTTAERLVVEGHELQGVKRSAEEDYAFGNADAKAEATPEIAGSRDS